jgi:hypothetical protein
MATNHEVVPKLSTTESIFGEGLHFVTFMGSPGITYFILMLACKTHSHSTPFVQTVENVSRTVHQQYQILLGVHVIMKKTANYNSVLRFYMSILRFCMLDDPPSLPAWQTDKCSIQF